VRWIVERCLSKEPAERYAMTRDLSRDLSSARDHLTELVRSRAGRIARRVAQGTSLAVLPVIDLSPGAPQDVVAETMTDALITELAQRRGLRVVSKLLTMACKGRRGALADLAEELGVEWVVLASIARIGREVRITAQLVECGTDENRWAHSYTRPARRILSLESEVAAAIAQDVEAAIHLRLGERHDRPDVSPVQRVAVSAA
jgi:TolB-like protein